MTEHSHSHPHEISHESLNLLYNSQFHREVKELGLPGGSDIEEQLERFWSEYVLSKKKVVVKSAELALEIIRKFLPEAKYILIYEDHSHDAPHGHIEAILDGSMHSIHIHGDWHDLEWTHEVDELVWDIYTLSKEYFSLVEGKRRLLLGA